MVEDILNKYIELINKGYCSDCNELNCISNSPHKDIVIAINEILSYKKMWCELKQVCVNVKNGEPYNTMVNIERKYKVKL